MGQGFSGKKAAEIVGITYRQIDYWARTDLIRPSSCDAAGSGSRRIYSYRDLLELRVIKTLLDAGIKLESVRDVFKYLRNHVESEIAAAHIVITEVVGNTYFAELHLRGSGGERVISCRPSDAVAIALRAGVPKFATEAIMDEVGKVIADTHVDTEEEILDEFRDFIDNIRPEDFQG